MLFAFKKVSSTSLPAFMLGFRFLLLTKENRKMRIYFIHTKGNKKIEEKRKTCPQFVPEYFFMGGLFCTPFDLRNEEGF